MHPERSGLQKQDRHRHYIFKQKRLQSGIAFFLELFGKPYGSFNVDFSLNRSSRMSLGVTPIFINKDDNHSVIVCPNVMVYSLRGRLKRFEADLGVSFIFYYPDEIKEDDRGSSFVLHGVLGYRYQKKNGLLFRIGFTPVFHVGSVFLPMIGISVGYSF